MSQGMVEFIIMIRGCMAVSDAILPRLEKSLFEGLAAETHDNHVLSLNPVDVEEIADILGDGLVSVRRLRPICRAIYGSRPAYVMFGEVAQDEFKHFTDRRNYAAQIIIAHFSIIEYIVATVAMASTMEYFLFRGAIVSAWMNE
ncbi:hypothetical protein DER46DRAFT_630183 [Fusarium sp. MPI-SDFR-AT-0072]|nr:hypothetical protein DER46DRAFT_630183 [Fusarium sp. MPI-SDFR-AT-0072]